MKSFRSVGICCLAVGTAFCISLGLLSCEKEQTTGENVYAIKGTVVDSITDLPIDSAAIAFEVSSNIQIYTDSVGVFRTARLPGTQLKVFAAKPGYTVDSQSIQISSDPTLVNFKLVPEK